MQKRLLHYELLLGSFQQTLGVLVHLADLLIEDHCIVADELHICLDLGEGIILSFPQLQAIRQVKSLLPR